MDQRPEAVRGLHSIPKTMKSSHPRIALVLSLAGVSASPFAAGALVVVNGDFQDTTGLVSLGGGWFNGVPVGWTGRSVNYAVFGSGGQVLVNLEQASNTAGSFEPFYQDLGILDEASTITLTFTLSRPWNANAISAGAAIWADGLFDSEHQLATQSNLAEGTHVLVAENVAAGTAIRIGFWRSSASGAPGLDDVSIEVTAVPEPPVALLGAAGMVGWTFRRRNVRKGGAA